MLLPARARRVRLAVGAIAVLITLAPSAARDAAAAAGDPVLPIDRAATAGARAVARGAEQIGPPPTLPSVGSAVLSGCDAEVLQRLVASDPTVAQWIVVSTATGPSPSGQLSIATVRNDAWVCTLPITAAQVGSSGIRPFLQRRSGDGSTPGGIFPLGTVASPQGPISFFGNSADPGTRSPYRRIRSGDCYGANPNTTGYGHWRVDSTGCVGDDELLERYVVAYEHAVLIGANTEPTVSGDAPGEIAYAAAIFLHRTMTTSSTTGTSTPKPTSGCVSIGHAQLVTALRAIDPALHPHFAIGTRADLLAVPARALLPRR